ALHRACAWRGWNSPASMEVPRAAGFGAGACWRPISRLSLLAWDTSGFFSTKIRCAGTTASPTPISRLSPPAEGSKNPTPRNINHRHDLSLSRESPHDPPALCYLQSLFVSATWHSSEAWLHPSKVQNRP